MDDRGTVDQLHAPGGTDRVVRQALGDLCSLAGVCRVGLGLAEGGGRRLLFTSTDQPSDRPLRWCHIDAYDDVPLTAVVRSGAMLAGTLDDLADQFAGVVDRQRADGVAAMAAVPLVAAGTPVGAFVLFYDDPDQVDGQREELTVRAARLARELRTAQVRSPREAETLAEEPVPDGVLVADQLVDGDPRAVGSARRFVRGRLAEWGVEDDSADTAVLCLSELVTNAVIHTGAPAELRLLLDGEVLTVMVRDAGTPRPEGPHRAGGGAARPLPDDDPLRVHGRGLQLVDALSSRWGSELDRVGTTVWFVLEDVAS